MSSEDYIGDRVRRGIPILKGIEASAVIAGVSVPVAVGHLLIAGLLTPPLGAVAAGTLTASALVFWLARGYRKGRENVLSQWNSKLVRPGKSTTKSE